MALYAKAFGDATVIGQETASRYEGFAAGSRQTVFLPNTQIRVRIPRYLLQNIDPALHPEVRNRGVLPDIPVEYTFEDLLEKRDRHMEKVRELIERR